MGNRYLNERLPATEEEWRKRQRKAGWNPAPEVPAPATPLKKTRLKAAPEPASDPVTVEVVRIVKPGVAEVNVSNGRPILSEYHWPYKERPSQLAREVRDIAPDCLGETQLELFNAAEQAKALERVDNPFAYTKRGAAKELHKDNPPAFEIPNMHGLQIARTWDSWNLIAGPTGVGKSYALLAMLRELGKHGMPGVVVALEDPPEWARRIARNGNDIAIVSDISNPEKLAEHLDKDGIQVVAVDPLRPLLRRLDVSENDSEAPDAVLGYLEPLKAASDGRERVLIVVHHLGKNSERGPRGTSANLDQAAAAFVVEPPVGSEEGVSVLGVFRAAKWRSGDINDQPRLKTYIRDGVAHAEPAAAPTLTGLLKLAMQDGEFLTSREWAERIGKAKDEARDTLRDSGDFSYVTGDVAEALGRDSRSQLYQTAERVNAQNDRYPK